MTAGTEALACVLPGLITKKPTTQCHIYTDTGVPEAVQEQQDTNCLHPGLKEAVEENSGGQLKASGTGEYQMWYMPRRCPVPPAVLHVPKPCRSDQQEQLQVQTLQMTKIIKN